MVMESTQQSVTIGGVVIAPGDLVMADDDGVVVIPTAVEDEVLAMANARASGESKVLGELLGGVTLRGVWQKYGLL
jgi:regulator of RNase E activity RraA